jgi:hypothetical protein
MSPSLFKILVLPTDVGDHGLKCFERKRVAKLVVGYNDAPAVRMPINPMTPAHSLQSKPVGLQSANELPRRHPRGVRVIH